MRRLMSFVRDGVIKRDVFKESRQLMYQRHVRNRRQLSPTLSSKSILETYRKSVCLLSDDETDDVREGG